jgi:hypothetical protein
LGIATAGLGFYIAVIEGEQLSMLREFFKEALENARSQGATTIDITVSNVFNDEGGFLYNNCVAITTNFSNRIFFLSLLTPSGHILRHEVSLRVGPVPNFRGHALTTQPPSWYGGGSHLPSIHLFR